MTATIVTGAASGIGRAIAEVLSNRSHKVVAFDVDEARLKDLCAAVSGEVVPIVGSVADPQDCKRAVEAAVEHFGGVAHLSHNAGIQRYGTVIDTSQETWQEVIDVNLTGAFNMAQAAAELIRQAKGSVVFMGSVQSLASQQNVVAYTASKHGLLGLTKAMAMDMAKDGVRVNMVAPGAVRTPMLEWAVSLSDTPQEVWGILNDMHPLGRVAEAREVACVAAFLMSDDAKFVTGEVVRVDGGLLSQLAGTPRKDG